MKSQILQLNHNAVPGSPLGNLIYFINSLVRVTSNHKLSREEFKLVKATVNASSRDKMGQWNKWKARVVNVVRVVSVLGAEWLIIQLG